MPSSSTKSKKGKDKSRSSSDKPTKKIGKEAERKGNKKHGSQEERKEEYQKMLKKWFDADGEYKGSGSNNLYVCDKCHCYKFESKWYNERYGHRLTHQCWLGPCKAKTTQNCPTKNKGTSLFIYI